MGEFTIEPLKSSHVRASFCCGQPSLDQFLQTSVSQYDRRRIGRTYVAVRPGESVVLGYYTLAASSIQVPSLPEALARKLPRHAIPSILLGRLAVDQSVRGQGLGRLLLIDALSTCLDISRRVGVFAVEVHAIDADARAFYLKFGFGLLTDNEDHLVLPVKTIAQEFGADEQ
jgi:GNAT superfamily N-acetyltransferase